MLLIDRYRYRDILSQETARSTRAFANVIQCVSGQFGCAACIVCGMELELNMPRLRSLRLVALWCCQQLRLCLPARGWIDPELRRLSLVVPMSFKLIVRTKCHVNPDGLSRLYARWDYCYLRRYQTLLITKDPALRVRRLNIELLIVKAAAWIGDFGFCRRDP